MTKPTPPCKMCNGQRLTHYYGTGPYAELRKCPLCSDGQKVADTIIPVVR